MHDYAKNQSRCPRIVSVRRRLSRDFNGTRAGCFFALKAWNAQRAGAAAVLIADNVDEQLLTMDSPEASPDTEYIDKINIPSALVNRAFGESLKKMAREVAAGEAASEEVVVKLDWRESMPHPDERVEYELWTNSNDECGARCDEQVEFVRGFRGHAQLLERGGYARFTPHYITWYCPEAFRLTQQCKSQCINHGRYVNLRRRQRRELACIGCAAAHRAGD